MNNDVTVQSRDFGGCTILTVPGDVDAGRVDDIEDAAVAADNQHVVLDLGKARVVHPSAAAELVALHHRIQARGGGVCIVTREIGVRAQVQQVGGDSAPRFYDEIGDALEASMADRQAGLGGTLADAVS